MVRLGVVRSGIKIHAFTRFWSEFWLWIRSELRGLIENHRPQNSIGFTSGPVRSGALRQRESAQMPPGTFEEVQSCRAALQVQQGAERCRGVPCGTFESTAESCFGCTSQDLGRLTMRCSVTLSEARLQSCFCWTCLVSFCISEHFLWGAFWFWCFCS